MMILGFTGTQLGMTGIQRSLVRQFLLEHKPHRVNHGGCIGADEDFHDLVREHLPLTRIFIYPSNIRGKQSSRKGDVVYVPEEPLKRNGQIVWMSDEMIACPKETEEQIRSGTWATIRRARKRRIPLHIFYPE